jgi:hypothetical protein
MIDLHFYLTAHGAERVWLERSLELLDKEDHSEIHRSLESLESALKRPSPREKIVVLEVAHRHDLEKIAPLEVLLKDAFVIILLPDRDPDTVNRAFRLRPRFISYIDKMNHEMIEVLIKVFLSKRRKNRELDNKHAVLGEVRRRGS